MKLNISKEDLYNSLSVVSRGMSTRSTLPILSGILMEARQEGDILLQTTDLEVSVSHGCLADIVEPGKVVVPGKLFMDIVKSLPDAAISISSEGEKLRLDCMGATFTVSTLSAADFPYFPEVAVDKSISLPISSLETSVLRVGRAVSKDESRVMLTGILFSFEEKRLRLVATDSYRLAVADVAVDGEQIDAFQAIIPGKVFNDVVRLAADEDTLYVGFSENQVVFRFGVTTFVTRIIEGRYPNYKQLIPSTYAASIRVDVDLLVTAIKRVSVVTQSHSPIRFSFSEQDQEVEISAQTADVGEAREVLPVEMEGEDIKIAFNYQYILDGLSSLTGECLIELLSPVKPGVVKPAQDTNFLYLAMPVRLS